MSRVISFATGNQNKLLEVRGASEYGALVTRR